MKSMRCKWVFRRDEIQGFMRLLRLCWERGKVGDGRGYSAKLSLALAPKVYSGVERVALSDWKLTLLGVRVHYCRSYGGIFG